MKNSLMNTIDLKVRSKAFNFDGSISRRITVIRGDSATGKTSLIDTIDSENPDVEIESSMPLLVAGNDSWEGTLVDNTDSIIFFDDLECTESGAFAKVCSEYLVKNNLFIVIINRQPFDNFILLAEEDRNLHSYTKVALSVSEIYDFKTNGVDHWLEPAKIPVIDDCSDVDCVLVEDRGKGGDFFENYFQNVVKSSQGKSQIMEDVLKLVNNHSKILVMIDLAAYGFHWEKFYKNVLFKYSNVFILPKRECFEQMLIYSNMLNNNLIVKEETSNLLKYANTFNSWENYFETLIDRVTYKRPYRCVHSRHPILSDCYLVNCSKCTMGTRITEKCDFCYKDSTDKLDALFRDTEFECILDLPRKDKLTNLDATKQTESLNSF